jgi:hypothetical protein
MNPEEKVVTILTELIQWWNFVWPAGCIKVVDFFNPQYKLLKKYPAPCSLSITHSFINPFMHLCINHWFFHSLADPYHLSKHNEWVRAAALSSWTGSVFPVLTSPRSSESCDCLRAGWPDFDSFWGRESYFLHRGQTTFWAPSLFCSMNSSH